LCTIAVCYRVQKQIRSSMRWSARRNTSNATQRRVFWQAFFYVLAFYLTIPFQLWALGAQTAKYWVLALVAAMAPAQGLMNCLVYVYKMQRPSSSSNRNRNNNNNNNNNSDGGAQTTTRLGCSWTCINNITFCCCWRSSNHNQELSGGPTQLSGTLIRPPSSNHHHHHQGENHQAAQIRQANAKESSVDCDTRNKTPTSSRLDDDNDDDAAVERSGDVEDWMEDEPVDGASP